MHMLFPHFKVTLSMFSSFRQQKKGFKSQVVSERQQCVFSCLFWTPVCA